jgi:Na+-driven multidrug efflux pump
MENDPNRKRFLWGMVLAWAPGIPVVIGVLYSFHGISGQRATGIGAVAAGFSEVFFTFSLIVIFVFSVAGIVLLGRSFSRRHRTRALFSVLSICWSALMLSIFGLFVWLSLVWLPQRAGGVQ